MKRLILAGLALLTACARDAGSPITGPGPHPDPTLYVITVVAGANQHGTAGEALPGPIAVQVRDTLGNPAPGVSVTFAPYAGEVSGDVVATDSAGQATTAWTLGWSPGPQKLSATALHAGEVLVTADAAVNPSADIVLVRGGAGLPLVVLVIDTLGQPTVYQLAAGDSVAYLPPHDGADGAPHWVVAFRGDRPPALLAPQWSAGTDTAAVTFDPPFPIQVTVWVVENFDQNAAIARRDLDATAALWAQFSWGLLLASPQVMDATAFSGTAPACGNNPLPATAGTINIYYSNNAQIGTSAGFTCSDGTILVKPSLSRSGQALLAHELGHTFSLFHVTDPGDLMNPTTLAPHTTTGEVFNAHFSSQSALNTVYHLHPLSALAACCIPQSFSVW